MLFSHVRVAACAILDKLCTFRERYQRNGGAAAAERAAGKGQDVYDDPNDSNDDAGDNDDADDSAGAFTFTEPGGSRSFTESMLQARVVARVLGYILHAHNWSTGLNEVYHLNSLPFDTELDSSVCAADRGDPLFADRRFSRTVLARPITLSFHRAHS